MTVGVEQVEGEEEVGVVMGQTLTATVRDPVRKRGKDCIEGGDGKYEFILKNNSNYAKAQISKA